MQEYKRRQFRGHPLSLAGKSLRTEGFRGVLASRAQLGLGDQLRFENNVPTIPSRLRFATLVCRPFRDPIRRSQIKLRRGPGDDVRRRTSPCLKSDTIQHHSVKTRHCGCEFSSGCRQTPIGPEAGGSSVSQPTRVSGLPVAGTVWLSHSPGRFRIAEKISQLSHRIPIPAGIALHSKGIQRTSGMPTRGTASGRGS